MAQQLMNLTSIHENSISVPRLAQQVKDLVLLWANMARIWHHCGCGVGLQLQLWFNPKSGERPYAAGAALKRRKKKKKDQNKRKRKVIWGEDKHVKRCLTSLGFRKMQMKTTKSKPFPSSRHGKLSPIIPNIGKHVDQLGFCILTMTA